MGKIREHTNKMREKCVELHKSGNGYKNAENALCPYHKKFKATGTVTKLPGRGPMFILPPHTLRGVIREAKKYPRITVGEFQRKLASWGHQVFKTTFRCHVHAKLFGRHAR